MLFDKVVVVACSVERINQPNSELLGWLVGNEHSQISNIVTGICGNNLGQFDFPIE